MSGSRIARVAILGVCTVAVASCSSPAPSANKTTTTTTPRVASCPSSSVSASVDFTKFGGSNSAPAGAVLFRLNAGSSSCSLRGVPQAQVVSDSGQPIPTFEAPAFPTALPTAVLTGGGQAASSITFSSWGCPVGSFSLSIRFPGWSSAVSATDGTPGGTCNPAQAMGQTLYLSPVTTTGS